MCTLWGAAIVSLCFLGFVYFVFCVLCVCKLCVFVLYFMCFVLCVFVFCVLCYVFLCFCVLCFVFCVLCYMWPVRAAVMRKPLALLASSPANLPRNVQTQHCNYFPLFTIIKWNPSHNFPVSLCDPSLTYTIILEPYSCPIYRCCGFSNLVLCWDLTWQEITQIFQFFIGVFFGRRG